MSKALTIGIGIILCWLATDAGAAQTTLTGRSGWQQEWNVAWLDLAAPINLSRGMTLEIHLIGNGPKEVVARIAPQGCSVAAACDIIGNCKKFPVHKGVVVVPIDEDYRKIVQISVHSGISGKAFDCDVDGGPMAQMSRVRLLTQ